MRETYVNGMGRRKQTLTDKSFDQVKGFDIDAANQVSSTGHNNKNIAA